MIRSAQLQGRLVVAEDGRRLGRVDEIHVRDGEVTVLTLGPGGLLERFRASSRGHRVAWDRVQRITEREIVVRRAD
jgi:sporulation protein YlmC with PRC-barrel domain